MLRVMSAVERILWTVMAAAGALAFGCAWRGESGEVHTLVLGLGVVSTRASAPATGAIHADEATGTAASASRLRARGLIIMPGLLLVGDFARHDLRISADADAHVELIDDAHGHFRTLGRVWAAARRPASVSLLPRRCVCHGRSCGHSGCGR